MTFSLLLTLLTLLAGSPKPEFGVLPQELRMMGDPTGAWVGRVGLRLAPQGIWRAARPDSTEALLRSACLT